MLISSIFLIVFFEDRRHFGSSPLMIDFFVDRMIWKSSILGIIRLENNQRSRSPKFRNVHISDHPFWGHLLFERFTSRIFVSRIFEFKDLSHSRSLIFTIVQLWYRRFLESLWGSITFKIVQFYGTSRSLTFRIVWFHDRTLPESYILSGQLLPSGFDIIFLVTLAFVLSFWPVSMFYPSIFDHRLSILTFILSSTRTHTF